MKHRFKNTCVNPVDLLAGVDTFAKFIRKLRKQANEQVEINPGFWDADTYFGDGFEAMCEVFINLSSIDKRVNIIDYSPTKDRDVGVDGVGKTHDGRIHTIQCKAKSNKTAILTANRDHLSNFVSHSTTKYGSDIEMTIMHSAAGTHHTIMNEMYCGKVNEITVKDFEKFLDKGPFWGLFLKELTKN